MRTTYALSWARGAGVSLLLALVLLSLPGAVGGSMAEAAQPARPQLAIWSGYDRPEGSREVRDLQRRLQALGHEPGPIDGLHEIRGDGGAAFLRARDAGRGRDNGGDVERQHARALHVGATAQNDGSVGMADGDQRARQAAGHREHRHEHADDSCNADHDDD